MTILESIARLSESTARLHAASVSLRATTERWAEVMSARLERRLPSSEPMSMREALGSESRVLAPWKRKPHSFHTLPNGEVIQYGPGRTHTMRADEAKTTYIRADYTMADCQYISQCILASQPISAAEANRILRKLKPDTSRSKRAPAEADPDVPSMEYGQRPERHLSARELVMESGLKGRALQRELRRVK